ncbi:MAG: hypothetical protein ACRCXQ_07445 [Vagococcus fluvialis]
MKRKVLLIMEFKEESYELQESLVEEFSDFEFLNVGDVSSQQNIIQDIINEIHNADVIIADLTGLNPNVFYELGIAHAFNKRVIQITQDVNELPFDIRQYRTLEYGKDYRVFKSFIKKLRPLLESIIEGEALFSNPVNDFLKKSGELDLNTIRNENLIVSDSEDEEKGFLDYLSEMEEYSESFLNNLENISTGIEVLSGHMNDATEEINRVNQKGGSGASSFVKKKADKLSKNVDSLVEVMEISSESMIASWQGIEVSILGLTDSKFIDNPENKNELGNMLLEFRTFKETIISTNTQVTGYRDSIQSIMGASRALTKSSKKLVSSIDNYLDGTEIMLDSLDKIERKTQHLTVNVL